MMHKLTKGLKKKKKQKKGKKGEDDDDFDPEELERYRQKQAEQEALAKQAEEASGEKPPGEKEEWKKFLSLTSDIDTVIKKTQDDLDRIKSTSFYQRKIKEPEPEPVENPEEVAKKKELAKRYKGFDKDGNPIEITEEEEQNKVKALPVNEDGLVEVPDDEEGHDDSFEEDIFDTTYLDELQNIEVQLAYIPDSPTQEELGDDPFDTSTADKVLKVVDKTGKKLVSLGNAVEVLAGRVDQVSTCKIGKNRPRPKPQDLLDIDAEVPIIVANPDEDTAPIEVEKTLLDDDSDLPDIPIDLTKLPPILTRPVTPAVEGEVEENKPLDISEFELLKDKTILDDVPTLDDEEFDLEAPADLVLEEAEDPFAEKEPETLDIENEIVEASFEAATFVNEDDPFDTTIAENIVPGKTELKFIEKELEDIPVSAVSISLTDPAGLHRNYETGLLKEQSHNSLTVAKKDLLGGSVTDLSQLADKPIQPVEEEISYVDPFDTTNIKELPPGQAELKVLEKELLSENKQTVLDDLDDDDFDPRAGESQPEKKVPPPRPATTPTIYNNVPDITEDLDNQVPNKGRKPSRPEALEIAPKVVAFELPNSKTDFLATNEEEKSLPAKPLTPYYPQKSIEEVLPLEEEPEEADVDPFDTSFVASPAPCKTELKIIESELLQENQAGGVSHSLNDNDFDPRSGQAPAAKVVKSSEVIESLIQENKRKAFGKRQDSILDTAVEVNTEPLAPTVKPNTIEEEVETIYKDPFDTSHATNILPGKAELKLLENELSQVPDPGPIRIHPVIEQIKKKATIEEDPDFDPREDEPKQKDILCLDTQEEIADKILTPIQDTEFSTEDIDPFDTSFASIGPGGNPFLMDDYSTDAAMAPASNPFLQDFGDPGAEAAAAAPPAADVNPFFSFGAADQTYQPPAGDSTNPFASFGMEAAAVPEPETGMFISPEQATVPQPEPNLFGEELIAEPAAATAAPPAPVMSPPQEQMVAPEVPAPVATSPAKPARPPPPPRPTPPAPPRNTKDLILSVTGAMDETSNQMLDRLQANRTPSPTLMHSPSPTPEHSFADLLDVDGGVPHTMAHDDAQQTPASEQQDILGLYDAAPPAQDASAAAFAADAAEPAVTADKTDDAPPATSTLTENPFSDVGQPEVQTFEPVYDQKRPSLSAATPVAITPAFEEVEAAVPEPQHYPEVAQAPASGLFGEAPVAAPAVDTSSFFAQPVPASTTPVASEAAFGNLIGDLSAEQSTTAYAPPSAPPTDYSQSQEVAPATDAFAATDKAPDAFDAFSSKFEKAGETGGDSFYDPFTGAPTGQTAMDTSSDVWGDSSGVASSGPVSGFDDEGDGFDSFLSMTAPPPEVTPRRRGSGDSDDAPDFSVVIRDRDPSALGEGGPVPVLAPPPKSPLATAYADSSPRFNPFDKSGFGPGSLPVGEEALPSELTRTDSQETPPTPLFDEDMSQPLEDFPRITYTGDGWEMQLRMPIKKKITGQRFWKKIFVKLVYQGDNPVLQLFNKQGEKDPFQELPLLACYSVSEIAAQQFDQYGKIFTVKLQYIFYKERPGVRPGQVTKAERITNKLSQFAAYAIQGDYQGVKEFGSDLKKLGLPVEHAPQISQLFKLGSQTYEDMKTFSVAIEEALFRLSAHRDRALQYKMEEVQISVVDETYVEQNADGHVEKQIARVRLFFLGFLSGMPDVELGINDIWRQGKEVVGRHDIIPVATEEWIRLENIEFHSCVQQDEYEKSKLIKFKPPDACYIELMRFRVRPPKNRELPLQLKAVMCVTGNKVELRADILVPGFASRKLGRVPCEDVMVRFPIPECWIYLFRVEKHFRYGSVKSAHRRTGKIKGIERLLGTMENMDPQLMEVTSGQAKYEHQHHAIVWRMPRLPKEGQGAYTTHQLVCRMNLTSFDQIPEKLAEYAYVEFTMPCTQVSHTTARSVSFQDFEGDEPPEKYVRNLSRHEYRVGIEHTQGEGPGAYVIATAAQPSSNLQTPKKTIPESSGDEGTDHAASDSDSSD